MLRRCSMSYSSRKFNPNKLTLSYKNSLKIDLANVESAFISLAATIPGHALALQNKLLKLKKRIIYEVHVSIYDANKTLSKKMKEMSRLRKLKQKEQTHELR